ncbi:hypothetical protein A5784_15680 [Mycobacterium sp. 852013-50091_SCH5140682]|uniref:DUF4245 domain-containing protein n=1 Tax=Mycobacterium sp. 852013-50091_SCH5140682 TaxID=1834109 RepID=UPI0007EA5D7C|nr:DUF4245 domain-containing protein [Mycobacterium sp. 852013-50091_SCH5140682]OBC02359.1 hypothetical protein A5784_15680 [Mycobacterium sp. 852013-50091_SCH5140682]
MTTQPTPVPKPEKSRLLQDGRDMFWSMAPLVLACIVLAGMLGMCSLATDGPGRGPAPVYDAAAGLRADADALKIPLRVPQLPAGWQANSGSRGSIDGGMTLPDGQRGRAVWSRVGYLTPTGAYLSLTQSNADETALVSSIRAGGYPSGTQNVDGVTWVVYESESPESVWTTRLSGPVQIAITGAGGTDEYRTLAEATQKQSPLPVKR